MGCCFSCFDDKSSQLEDVCERTTLLGNPVSNNVNRIAYHDDYGTQHTSAYGQRGDEQSALSRILHQTASNVIDVSAMDSHLEQHEYLDRARHYQQRLLMASHPSSYPPKSLLADLPFPDKILASEPISAADHRLMAECFLKVEKALESLKVAHKEDLVVQFGIP